jgi:hypothetical protein
MTSTTVCGEDCQRGVILLGFCAFAPLGNSFPVFAIFRNIFAFFLLSFCCVELLRGLFLGKGR